ncbi:MAG: RloB domain-containing protein [Bacteroidetes bacterium]|nr:RloB domain-containing protein [Bacteroidota bacterium]MBL7103582.1 RloB domain-containing protein [Bacteroidales bacterium]
MINISKRILILCEDGKSSKLYFESFKKDEKLKRELSSVEIEVIHPKDHSPVGLVTKAKEKKKKAKRDRNPYDEIWIVLDKDYHANVDKALNIAKDNKITVALSIICFEYWILLHFEKTTKPFVKCEDVIKYIKKNHFKDYEKNTNCYLALKDKVKYAIENGEWLLEQTKNDIERGKKITGLSAYTDVHLLVRKLIDPNKFLN